MNVVWGPGQIVQQKLQQQSAAQAPALDLELGKALGQIRAPDVVHPDEAGILHGPGKAIASGGVRGCAAVDRAALSQIFPADGLIAGPPLPAAEITALVAQKFYLVPQRLGQGIQPVKGPVQPKIRYHAAKLRPLQLLPQSGKICKHLGGG